MRRVLLHIALLAVWLACSAADAMAQRADDSASLSLTTELSAMLRLFHLYGNDFIATVLAVSPSIDVIDAGAMRVRSALGIGIVNPSPEHLLDNLFVLAQLNVELPHLGGSGCSPGIGLAYMLPFDDVVEIECFTYLKARTLSECLHIAATLGVDVGRGNVLELFVRAPLGTPVVAGSMSYPGRRVSYAQFGLALRTPLYSF